MRIKTFDIEQHNDCDIDVPLRQLAASPKPMVAAYWQKILQLVVYLQSIDPDRIVQGQILGNELELVETIPPDLNRDRELKKFFDEWRASNPDPKKNDDRFRQELKRRSPPDSRARITVWVDSTDYSTFEDGKPALHYRFQVRRPGKELSEDGRANDIESAVRFIYKVFGWL